MLMVHLLGRSSLLRSGLFRLRIQRRFFCAAQRSRCPDTTQETNMIRSRTQIKRVLCVAEKNDAAKGISEIMSSGRARRVSHVFDLLLSDKTILFLPREFVIYFRILLTMKPNLLYYATPHDLIKKRNSCSFCFKNFYPWTSFSLS